MASGFINRAKGKSDFSRSDLYVAGMAVYGHQTPQVTLSTASTTNVINGWGFTMIGASSAKYAYYLQKPRVEMLDKVIIANTVSSAVLIAVSTDGSITINGSSYSVFQSTVPCVLRMSPTSTSNWALTAIGSTGGTGYVFTLSTST